jgi:hypothetical protein
MATVLLQFLVNHHNIIVRMFFDQVMFPGENKVDLPVIDVQEIIDTSMLVSVDGQDLHLALVANSEYNFGVGESSGNSKWILNEAGLEQYIIDK